MHPPIKESNPDFQSYFSSGVPLSDAPVLLTEQLVMQTAFLKSYQKPISLLLIGKPGIGKSRLLYPLSQFSFVSYVNDITPYYLVKFLEQVKNGEKRILVINDFTSASAHGKATQKTLNAILRGMTEEGITDLSDYKLEFKSDRPARASLITSITSSSYQEFAQSWKKTGFLSRLLPFSFKHSIDTKTRILNEIDAKNPDPVSSVKLRVITKPKKLSPADTRLFSQLRAYSELLSKETASEPYRHQIQLDSIAEASAVLRGSSDITQQDVDLVHWLSNWINYDFREV